MSDRLPLLIFAQSGRFIAQSATRAGFSVRVADCFADQDLLAVADNWQRLPPLATLTEKQLLTSLTELSGGENCLLVCGSGIEAFHAALSQLPANIRLLGNSPGTIAKLRSPKRFFTLLNELKLPYPTVSFNQPLPGSSLFKDFASTGGTAVSDTRKAASQTSYWQQQIHGESRSVCFIADGVNARILGWNRQLNRSNSYQLAQIIQSDQPDPRIISAITSAVAMLTRACDLRGLNSLDFLVDSEGQYYLLELNPRITASAELLKAEKLVEWHVKASEGELAQDAVKTSTQAVRLLSYLFADRDYLIQPSPQWPESCHDLPAPGTQICEGDPICTLMIESESASLCQQALQKQVLSVQKNCLQQA